MSDNKWPPIHVEARGCDPYQHGEEKFKTTEATRVALAENLRRVFKKMHRLLDLREEDSALIDLVNHADTLAQQLEEAEDE